MIYSPKANQFNWVFNSNTTVSADYCSKTIPTRSTEANAVWTQVASAANVANDVYEIKIMNKSNSYGTTRIVFFNVGIDTAGGTSYTTVIDTLCMSSNGSNPLCVYTFPLFIPAGSTIAIKAITPNQDSLSTYADVVLYGRPTNPESIRTGTSVTTYKNYLADRTPITCGTTSQGSWTTLRESNTDQQTILPHWYWQVQSEWISGTGSNIPYVVDVAITPTTSGDEGSNLLISRGTACSHGEVGGKGIHDSGNRIYKEFPAGSYIRARGWSSNDTAFTFLVFCYGVT